MSIEDRLRRAIDARTSSVDPSTDALGRITDKMSDQGAPMNLNLSSTRTRVILGLAAAVVLLAAVVAGLMLPDDGDRTETGDTADRSTTTTEEPGTSTTDRPSERPGTSTTASTTTSTTTPASRPSTTTATPSGPSEAEQRQIVWPRPSSDVRFSTPEAAARSFARFYARFRDPVVGAFRQGDSRSGEVPVHAFANGPETTILVRQFGGSWFVIGSQAEQITLATPSTGSSLACPQHVEGTALAFEGTVQVRIDAYQPDGDRVELGSGFVTGSGSEPAGPYEGDIACRFPGAAEQVEAYGILTLWEPSAEDGSTLAITAIPLAVAAT